MNNYDGKNYVSSTIKRMRKRLQEDSDNCEVFKTELKEAVTFGVQDFSRRLQTGEIKIDNVSDFERLSKLGLLLYGEATERIEETSDVEEVTISEFNELKNSEEFEKITQKLSDIMNKRNEKGGN